MPAPTDLELSVFRTLCWFSVFEIPLSSFEVWKWILRPARPYGLFEVDCVLNESEWLHSRINSSRGMYVLEGSAIDNQFVDRQRRFLDAARKFKKLRIGSFFFQLLPSVRAVFAANTMSWWHTTSESDVDLFIITHPGRIWSSRLLLVLPFLLTGNRPHHAHSTRARDPFCFSFFATSNALQMEPLKCAARDEYLAYWVKSLVPMFDRDRLTDQLVGLNKWADAVLPNARLRNVHPLHKPRRMMPLPIQWPVLETALRTLQRRRFPRVLRELANKDSRVVITDDMLKFHENDRRMEFIQKFEDAYERAR